MCRKRLAPIVLFVYNRPWHTQQTVEALQKNDLAEQSELFIYADGPKIPSDSKVQAVRDYIKTINGFKRVTIIEREKNWGLADNIVDGVTSIVNRYGKIIVLEDDILTSIAFLKYMNNALWIYENEERVYSIAAYIEPINYFRKATFFLTKGTSWGWGTWKSVWKDVEWDAPELLKKIQESNLESEFNFSHFDYTGMLKDQISGLINSWAIRFYAHCFVNNGLHLTPSISLSANLGFDNSGTHCKENSFFSGNQVYGGNIKVRKKKPKPNKMIPKIIYLKRTNTSILSYLFNVLKSKLKN